MEGKETVPDPAEVERTHRRMGSECTVVSFGSGENPLCLSQQDSLKLEEATAFRRDRSAKDLRSDYIKQCELTSLEATVIQVFLTAGCCLLKFIGMSGRYRI